MSFVPFVLIQRANDHDAASSSSSNCFLCSSAYKPSWPDQFVVRAAFDDAASIEDEDLVGVADRGDAVRDDDRGALAHHATQARRGSPPRCRCPPADSASSRIRMRGSMTIARASAGPLLLPAGAA